MRKKPYRSKFEKWVYQNAGGPRGLSESMGVHLSSVYFWLAGKNAPKLKDSLFIVQLSSGKLKLKDIVDGTKPQ